MHHAIIELNSAHKSTEITMPIQPNFLERTAFFTLNAAPAPMLDLAGALAFQTVRTAVKINLFDELNARPATLSELSQSLGCHERGLKRVLQALASINYVTEKDGRFHNTALVQKWFFDSDMMDIKAAMHLFNTYFLEFWPHAPEVLQSGERPYQFYDFINRDPALSHAFQQTMVGNATFIGPDIVKKIKLPEEGGRLLDIGGGHGIFTIQFCQANPQLQATILDSAPALETAKKYVAEHRLTDRIELFPSDIWQIDLEQTYDLILLFNFIHNFDLETNIKLLQKTHAALKPGGQVAILDQLEGAVSGSATNAIVQLLGFMFYLLANGRIFSHKEIRSMMGQAGFKGVQIHTSAKWTGSSLVTAVK
jgi:ubiquinone/menaquinone biosynthesis C-methylase UbiE